MSNVITGQIKQVNNTNQVSKTSHTDVECPSNIDPQIRVTDGIQGLEAGVKYHGLTTVSCGCQEPEVRALGQCEGKGKAGCGGSLLVEGL